MSEEQLKAFLEKVKSDTTLQEKLKSAKTAVDVVGIAKEYGHEFTSDTINQLRDEELEGVSGGNIVSMVGSPNWQYCQGLYGTNKGPLGKGCA